MILDRRNEPAASLSDFHTALLDGTHGRIHDLTVQLYEDGWVVVRGVARSYYGVQLAIHVAKQFVSAHRLFPQTQLLLRVDGTRLEFLIAQAAADDAEPSMSTRGVGCLPQLTTAASV